MDLLSLEKLSKKYGDGPWIFQDLSFRLQEKENVALVGVSGSGKTTLLHLLAGIDTPTEGEVRYLGRDIATYAQQEKDGYHRYEVGIIFQAFHVVPYLTVEENIALPQIFLTGKTPVDQKRVAALVEKVGLANVRKQKASHVSGGQRQRIAIARALVNHPKLILADEPTGNLDVETGEKIIQLLTTITKEEGASLFLVTHELPHLSHMDRVLELTAGKLKQRA